MTRPYKSFEEREAERRWDRFPYPRYSGVERAPYGFDHLGRLYFNVAVPWVRSWVVRDASEVFFYPERSGGRVSVEGSEIVVRR